jgi:epoxyqueuosine reductase QueG
MAKKKAVKIDKAVQDKLAKLGVDLVGVVRIDEIKGTKLAKDALRLLPAARSIVVMGMEVYAEFLDLTKPKRVMGTANLNEMYRRHTDSLGGRLGGAAYDIAQASHRAGLKALPLPGHGPAVDGRFLEAVISYKDAGAAAGLGSIGMNSLLVTPQYGPRVQLALCLTEASLASTAGKNQENCQFCNVCVFKCPAKALARPKKGETHAINRYACRTYVEAAGGCSECMRVCPVASPVYK